jgi:hypothetical protein
VFRSGMHFRFCLAYDNATKGDDPPTFAFALPSDPGYEVKPIGAALPAAYSVQLAEPTEPRRPQEKCSDFDVCSQAGVPKLPCAPSLRRSFASHIRSIFLLSGRDSKLPISRFPIRGPCRATHNVSSFGELSLPSYVAIFVLLVLHLAELQF